MNMSSPYRTPPEVISLWKPRTISGYLHRLKRKATVVYCGKHAKRHDNFVPFKEVSLKNRIRYYTILLTDEVVNHFANGWWRG